MALGNEEPSVAQTWLAPAVAGASERLRTIGKQKAVESQIRDFSSRIGLTTPNSSICSIALSIFDSLTDCLSRCYDRIDLRLWTCADQSPCFFSNRNITFNVKYSVMLLEGIDLKNNFKEKHYYEPHY